MKTATSQRPWKQYWTPIADRRSTLQDLARCLDQPQEFHILGAGVAALAAAIEILALPLPGGRRHSVTIYEASKRVGGRIDTKRIGRVPAPEAPDTRPTFERGAMRIPTSHDYTWTYAREARPHLRRRRFLNDDRTHDFRGTVYRPPNPEAVARAYGVRDPEAGRGPGYLFGKHVLEPEMKVLDEAYKEQGGQDYWAALMIDGRIEGEGLRRIDALSLQQVLEHRLRRTDPGLIDYLSAVLFPGLLDRAFLMYVRSWLTNRGDLYELCRDHGGTVVGGMDLLVAGMRARIDAIDPNIIQLERPVIGISTEGSDWEVRFAGGERLRKDGNRNRHLLCTLPFPVLRQLGMRGFPREKVEAVRGVSYMHATKVALHVKERFWEAGFKGGRSLTDRGIISSYYPNDHNPDEPIGGGGEIHADYDLYTQPAQTQTETDVTAIAERDRRPGPWLLLSSYTFGEFAQEMGKRPPLHTVTDLTRVLPALRNSLAEGGSETWYWNSKPLFGGALVLPTPRNVSQFYQTARRPDGGVFFAGEHVSPEPGWIQGSLFSSLYAMEQILRSALGLEATPEDLDLSQETKQLDPRTIEKVAS